MEVQYRHFLNEFCREMVDLVIEVLKGLRTLAAPETACSRVRTVSFVPIEVMCNFASSFGENVSSQRGNRTASLPATTLSTETYSSTTVVTTLERAFNLHTCIVCLFLSRDGERRPECRKVQCHRFPMGLFRQEIAIVLFFWRETTLKRVRAKNQHNMWTRKLQFTCTTPPPSAKRWSEWPHRNPGLLGAQAGKEPQLWRQCTPT